MKKSIILIIGIVALCVMNGCASVQIYSNEDLKGRTGLKFYPVKLYLLVELKAEKDMTVKTSVIYLPDLANPQYLKVKPGAGSSELKMAFTNGILNSYGVTTDAKLDETINSIAGLISKSSDAFRGIEEQKMAQGKPAGEVNFILYEIVITKEATKLVRVGE